MRKRVTCFVVFVGAEHRRWWRIFTRRGWRHVRLIVPAYDPYPSLLAKEYAQLIDFWTDHLRCDVIFKPARQLAYDFLREGATCVVEYPLDQKFTGKYLPRGILTCVSLVKGFLSINAPYVIVPEQLARWLVRHGGTLITAKDLPNDVTIQQAESGQESATGRGRSATETG